MTIKEAYAQFVLRLLTVYEQREAETITDWIFEDVAHIPRLDRIIAESKELDSESDTKLSRALDQLLVYTPVQYVLGEASFFKMRLKVNTNVLIPRPETEEVVSWVIEDYQKRFTKSSSLNPLPNNNVIPQVLDIGTGSGCIALALKKEIRELSIMAIDVSEAALGVATNNAKDYNLEIDFRKIDFLQFEKFNMPDFDIIVSNPPYISETARSGMARNVIDHEPHLALFPGTHDHLVFYKKTAEFGETHLKKNGAIYLEIPSTDYNLIVHIFNQRNFKCILRKDFYGMNRLIRCERIIKAPLD